MTRPRARTLTRQASYVFEVEGFERVRRAARVLWGEAPNV